MSFRPSWYAALAWLLACSSKEEPPTEVMNATTPEWPGSDATLSTSQAESASGGSTETTAATNPTDPTDGGSGPCSRGCSPGSICVAEFQSRAPQALDFRCRVMTCLQPEDSTWWCGDDAACCGAPGGATCDALGTCRPAGGTTSDGITTEGGDGSGGT